HCTFDISATLSTKFWRRKTLSNQISLLKFNANYLDLIYATANRNLIHIPPAPNILIYNNPVLEIFKSNSSSLYLNNIAISITNFTDSQSVISKYQKLTQTITNLSHLYSYNNWPIWHTLLNLVKSYKLTISFHKVLAHSDNELNNVANTLTQNHQTLPTFEFQ